LINNLAQTPPQLGVLYDVPQLPPHFLARTETHVKVRNALRDDLTQSLPIGGAIARVGIYGMGGIGKTVLAAAVAHDRDTRLAFPDGIAWIHVGPHPIIANWQNRLHRVFGDSVIHQHDGRKKLGKLPDDKRVLFILDDVWRGEDIAWFNEIIGANCRVMILTRNLGLLPPRTVQHQIEVLTNREALNILAQMTDVERDELPNEATGVIAECGHLPLAVALCGGMVNSGIPWHDVLTALREHKLESITKVERDLEFIRNEDHADPQIKDPDHINLWLAMEVSVRKLSERAWFEPLLKDAACRFSELAVFPTDTPIPEAAVLTLWSHSKRGGLSKSDGHKLLILLQQRSLVQLTSSVGTTGSMVSLHALLFDLAVLLSKRNNPDAKLLHNDLIDAYAKLCRDGWPSGPNDGYFFSHLPSHFSEAGRHAELYALALDERFLTAQTHSSPNEPDIPLRTLRTALLTANNNDDPINMADFLLRHAKRSHGIRRESITNALQEGHLDRALNAAGLLGDEERTVYRLLLAWDFLERDQRSSAYKMLCDLRDEGPSRSETLEKHATFLLAMLVNVETTLIGELADRLLATEPKNNDSFRDKRPMDEKWSQEDLHPRVLLFKHLIDCGNINAAILLVQPTQPVLRKESNRKEVLHRIAIAHASVGKLEEAKKTNELSGRPSWKILHPIAEWYAKAGDCEGVIRTLVDVPIEDYYFSASSRSIVLMNIVRQSVSMHRVDELVQVAQKLADQRIRAELICAVVTVLSECGGIAFAQDIVEAELHGKHWQEAAKARRVIAAAQAHAALGRIDEINGALATARKIQYKKYGLKGQGYTVTVFAFDRALAEAAIAREVAIQGLVDKAREIFVSACDVGIQLTDPVMRGKILCQICIDQYRVGMTRDAEATFHLMLQSFDRMKADKEENQYHLSNCVEQVAVAQARAGQLDIARVTAKITCHEDFEVRALKAIVTYQTEHVSTEAALATARTKLDNVQSYDDLVATIASSLSARNQWLEAIRTINNPQIGIDYRAKRLEATLSVAISSTLSKQTKNARQYIAEALLDRSLRIYGFWYQGRALAAAGRGQAMVGRVDEARDSFGRARAFFMRHPRRGRQALGLLYVQVAQYRGGVVDDAKETLKEICKLAGSIEHKTSHDTILRTIFLELARSGQTRDALESCSKIYEETKRAAVLSQIALMLFQSGQEDDGRKNFEEAKKAARKKKKGYRAGALCNIGELEIQAGLLNDALQTLTEAGAALADANTPTQQKGIVPINQSKRLVEILQSLSAGSRIPEQAPPQLRADALITLLVSHSRSQVLKTEQKRQLFEDAKSVLLEARNSDNWLTKLLELSIVGCNMELFDESLVLLDALEDEPTRASILEVVASALGRAGKGARAVETAKRIQFNQQTLLPKIATSLADSGERDSFRELLMFTAYFLDTALLACGDLARLYPKASAAIAEMIGNCADQ
jgi:tetratricopeptide (TPR) repeat protein